MCIFSGDEVQVKGTRIFARRDGERQLLAYQMEVSAAHDVAMVLPLPVAVGSGEGAVRFLDLSGYPAFFDDLAGLYPAVGGLDELSLDLAEILEVHHVGAFDASYVPSIADFGRLDPHFQLAPHVWSALPQYRDFGFAVFKLARATIHAHPMAFAFPTRSERLFFPTVHVHDGTVHDEADFDHTLYCQGAVSGWDASYEPPSRTAVELSKGLLVRGGVRRRELHGRLANADVYA